jgi:hypothetical protein
VYGQRGRYPNDSRNIRKIVYDVLRHWLDPLTHHGGIHDRDMLYSEEMQGHIVYMCPWHWHIILFISNV